MIPDILLNSWRTFPLFWFTLSTDAESIWQHPLCICKLTMSAAAGRVAGKLGNAASKAAETATKSGNSDNVLKKAAKRDPELYVWNMDLRLPSVNYLTSSIDANGRSSWLSWLEPSASLVSILVHFTLHPVPKETISNNCKLLCQAVSPPLPRPKPVLVWPRGACHGKSEARKVITLAKISNTNIIPAEIGTNHPKMLQVH